MIKMKLSDVKILQKVRLARAPPIEVASNDNLGQIEVPPECLEPYIPPKSLITDFNHPIGITIKGDMVYAFGKC